MSLSVRTIQSESRPGPRPVEAVPHVRGSAEDARRLATVIPLRRAAPTEQNRRTRRRLMGSERGLATAEYAIATLAAVGFAALLVAVLSSGDVRELLMSLITSALSFG